VSAPFLLLVDNLIHPKEFSPDHELEQIAEIADNYRAWQLAHFFGFLAILTFVIAVLGLAFMVRRRMPRAGLVGGALAMLGLMCFASIIALDGFTWGVLGEVSARTTDTRIPAETLTDIQQSQWNYQFYLPALGFAIGMVTLAIAAARSGAVPAWTGYLLALGALLAGTEGLIVSNAYYVLGSAVLLAGSTAVAIHIYRMSDEEFATTPSAEEPAEQHPQVILP
jgi:hypothetical protein